MLLLEQIRWSYPSDQADYPCMCRFWNKFYPREICEIPTCWGEGSVGGLDETLIPTDVHKAQKEETVNDELRITYNFAIPSQQSNLTLVGANIAEEF